MTDTTDKKASKLDLMFPDYRIWEDVPFGFWYLGFLAMTLAFFNLSINFFSHLALLLGWLMNAVREYPREPKGLDLALSGVFALYYIVSAPLLFFSGSAYWNFKEGVKSRLRTLLIVDAAVFVLYNVLYLSGIYLYQNPYLRLKAPIYIILVVLAFYYISTKVEDDAKSVIGRVKGKA